MISREKLEDILLAYVAISGAYSEALVKNSPERIRRPLKRLRDVYEEEILATYDEMRTEPQEPATNTVRTAEGILRELEWHRGEARYRNLEFGGLKTENPQWSLWTFDIPGCEAGDAWFTAREGVPLGEKTDVSNQDEEVKPSDLVRRMDSMLSLPGAFRNAETEQGAALIIHVCAATGDTWRALRWQEVLDFLSPKMEEPSEEWRVLYNPYFRPDPIALAGLGYAKYEGEGEEKTVSLTPAGIKRAAQSLGLLGGFAAPEGEGG